jgi:carbamoyl-phosphate synthase large subunit
VKEAVLPFDRFPGVDALLGPGDALDRRGHGHRRGLRRGVREVAGGDRLDGAAPSTADGSTEAVFVSVANRDKRAIVFPSSGCSTSGSRSWPPRGPPTSSTGPACRSPSSARCRRRPQHPRPARSGRIKLVLNTPFGQGTRGDGYEIRQAAVTNGVPCITTLSGILAAIQGVEALRRGDVQVHSLQEYQAALRPTPTTEETT